MDGMEGMNIKHESFSGKMQRGFETDKGNKIEKSVCKNFLDQRLSWHPPSIWSVVYFQTSDSL